MHYCITVHRRSQGRLKSRGESVRRSTQRADNQPRACIHPWLSRQFLPTRMHVALPRGIDSRVQATASSPYKHTGCPIHGVRTLEKVTLAWRSFTWKGGVAGSRLWPPSGDKKGCEAILGYVRRCHAICGPLRGDLTSLRLGTLACRPQ